MKDTKVEREKIIAPGGYVNGEGADAGCSAPLVTMRGVGFYVNGKGAEPYESKQEGDGDISH